MWLLLLVLVVGAFAGGATAFQKQAVPEVPMDRGLRTTVLVASLVAGAAAAICVVDLWIPIRAATHSDVGGITEVTIAATAQNVLLHGAGLLGLAAVIRVLPDGRLSPTQ